MSIRAPVSWTDIGLPPSMDQRPDRRPRGVLACVFAGRAGPYVPQYCAEVQPAAHQGMAARPPLEAHREAPWPVPECVVSSSDVRIVGCAMEVGRHEQAAGGVHELRALQRSAR
jgi:hypothetical protein